MCFLGILLAPWGWSQHTAQQGPVRAGVCLSPALCCPCRSRSALGFVRGWRTARVRTGAAAEGTSEVQGSQGKPAGLAQLQGEDISEQLGWGEIGLVVERSEARPDWGGWIRQGSGEEITDPAGRGGAPGGRGSSQGEHRRAGLSGIAAGACGAVPAVPSVPGGAAVSPWLCPPVPSAPGLSAEESSSHRVPADPARELLKCCNPCMLRPRVQRWETLPPTCKHQFTKGRVWRNIALVSCSCRAWKRSNCEGEQLFNTNN